MSRIVLVEDDFCSRFSPLTLLRPVFELRCGHFTVGERLKCLAPAAELSVLIRKHLQPVYAQEHPGVAVNDPTFGAADDTLYINGRWLCDAKSFSAVSKLVPASAAILDGQWVAVCAPKGTSLVTANDVAEYAKQARPLVATGKLLQFPWELIEQNASQIRADFELRPRDIASQINLDDRVAVLGDSDKVFVHPAASIDPFVVIDARHGPVWIDEGAKIQAFTRLEGPCFIGHESQLFRANVREGCSIGPVCRVGGEIEESIIHGYANKYHDGFLGHAYICPWVNLGANTINSDLKNDYSSVKLMVNGEMLDTGSTKVGCFIGDHSKTALSSLFNTGSSVGIMSLILPGGELLPKVIPSFTRIWHGQLELNPTALEAGIASARTAMGRRKQELTPEAEELLRIVYQQTEPERAKALERWHSR
ncbi:MAG: putative sugar nucleotidyl transferase [Planctomycetaceae bacterium]